VTDPAGGVLTTANDPQTVTVPAGGTGTAGDVGFQFQGTIDGHVFEDVDGDGTQGAGEPDLAGVDVTLTPAGGGAPITVTTDVNGDYSSTVPSGDVDADVTDPANSTLTTANDPQTVTVPVGGTGTATDVGFQFQGTIDGHLFEDVDSDGAQGAGEPDLAGVDERPATIRKRSPSRSAVQARRPRSGSSSRVRSTVTSSMMSTVMASKVRVSPIWLVSMSR
jgi:hypothetical protein